MTSAYYIDPDEFIALMAVYKQKVDKAKEQGKPNPPIGNSIGKMFVLLAQNIVTKGNFNNYPFKEEMVGDAIENMVRYAHNYDPTIINKTSGKSNPFAYFTQIAYYAFLRRIKKEKKAYHTKQKLIQQLPLFDLVDYRQEHDEDMVYQNEYLQYLVDNYGTDFDKSDPSSTVDTPKAISTVNKTSLLFGECDADV